jgi:GR25 family glycosyltransferase involved in LPS biosynthesis
MKIISDVNDSLFPFIILVIAITLILYFTIHFYTVRENFQGIVAGELYAHALYQPSFLPINSNAFTGYRIFVINLKETESGKKRWYMMKSTVFANTMERFDGVNGHRYDYSKEVSQNIVATSWDYGMWKLGYTKYVKMAPGEIGVSLSHYYLWKKIVDENIKRAIILEDDSSVIDPYFEDKFHTVMKSVPSNWDIVLISFWLHKGDNGEKVNANITRVKDFVFMNAYVINTKGARKLCDSSPINMPLDSWVSKLSKDVVIYRHHHQTIAETPRGTLIAQAAKQIVGSSIDHTNNW